MSHSRKSSKESLNGRRTPAPVWAEKGNSMPADVESQKSDSKSRRSAALEHGVDTRTKFLYLGSWFALNLILTLYNKSLLQGVGDHSTCWNIRDADHVCSSDFRGFSQHYTRAASPSAATFSFSAATSSSAPLQPTTISSSSLSPSSSHST